MNSARIVVLAIAIGAGAVAAYLASSGGGQETAGPPAPVAQLPTVDVLVAKSDIPLGQHVGPDDVQWQSWPTATASSQFIRRNEQPEAPRQLVGSIARSPFIAGEPIREQKLVKAEGSGFMAAILPTGMRAVSTEISPETGAGGFILPNDRVDVILSKRDRNPDRAGGGGETVNSEIILSNVRVLAIDQTVEEKNGQKVVVGKTATLELKPDQAEFLARARQSGTLSLALRSLADANAPAVTDDTGGGKRDSINVVRYGVATQTTMPK
ncbi:Flp pilus assembly protein CpaB [Rhodopseudomonas sp.]|uniref:Flp pilus assembly protein CpaB n=1 Tax=Rhodopseudomonas sp. TaxID=1078 RepID=UPI003B3BE812